MKDDYIIYDQDGNMIIFNFMTGLRSLVKVMRNDVNKFEHIFLKYDTIQGTCYEEYENVFEQLLDLGILVPDTLMGLTDANIIAFVMYPITYSKDWNGVYGNAKYRIDYCEFEEKATILQEKFNIPVFLLGNQQHMHELCQEIIEFF